MRAQTLRLLVSRKRLFWGAIFFAVFLFGAEMCATISRTGADISVWAMVAVVTIAGATGTGWLAGMPSREAPSPPPPMSGEQDVDTWSRFEDSWVEA
jgi:hypothetical protein